MQAPIILSQPAEFYAKLHLKPDTLPGEAYDAWGQDDTVGRPNDPLTFSSSSARRYSVIARVVFRNGVPDEVVLTPVDISMAPRATAGVPSLADPVWAVKVLERLQELSKPYGTRITIENGIGTIKISKP